MSSDPKIALSTSAELEESKKNEAAQGDVDSVAVSPPYPLGDHVTIPRTFTYFTERYFSQFLIKDCKGVVGNNIRLLLHSNMLCILCLDPSHELVVRRQELKISYLGHSMRRPGHAVKEREPIKVQGKKKKNAMICQKEMNLCFIETECGKEYRIPAGIDGSVLEINSNLTKFPSLIQRFPTTEGFIAVINPHAKVRFDLMEKVWTCSSGELAEGDD